MVIFGGENGISRFVGPRGPFLHSSSSYWLVSNFIPMDLRICGFVDLRICELYSCELKLFRIHRNKV